MTHNVQFDRPFLRGWCVGGRRASDHRLELNFGDGPQEIALTLGNAVHKNGFGFDTNDPIWIVPNEGECPQQAAIDPQIHVLSCCANELKLRHDNSSPVELRYQLNVVKNGKNKPIDPIMSNGPHR
jgi:hypothetical protein